MPAPCADLQSPARAQGPTPATSYKPALAAALLERAVAAGVPARWVAADEVYGADPELRRAIRRTGLGYVLQIGANRWVPPPAGGG